MAGADLDRPDGPRGRRCRATLNLHRSRQADRRQALWTRLPGSRPLRVVLSCRWTTGAPATLTFCRSSTPIRVGPGARSPIGSPTTIRCGWSLGSHRADPARVCQGTAAYFRRERATIASATFHPPVRCAASSGTQLAPLRHMLQVGPATEFARPRFSVDGRNKFQECRDYAPTMRGFSPPSRHHPHSIGLAGASLRKLQPRLTEGPTPSQRQEHPPRTSLRSD